MDGEGGGRGCRGLGAVEEGVEGLVAAADVGQHLGPHQAVARLGVGALEVGEAREVVALVVAVLHGERAA